jgi:8-oxo-dGTP diphosphatase
MARMPKPTPLPLAEPRRGHTYRHPHPAVAVDLAIFTVIDRGLRVLLIERGVEPFKGRWALPGGFVRIEEDLLGAAERELREETAVSGVHLEQLGAFGHPRRDPRERVISVAFVAILASDHLTLAAGTDAAQAQWWPFASVPALAFDHRVILAAAQARVAEQLRRSPIAFQFLKPEFTLTELQQVHEAILGQAVDKRNFRKWVASLDVIKATGRAQKSTSHRPAALYRLKAQAGSGYATNRSDANLDARVEADSAALQSAYARGYRDGVRAVSNATAESAKSLVRAAG